MQHTYCLPNLDNATHILSTFRHCNLTYCRPLDNATHILSTFRHWNWHILSTFRPLDLFVLARLSFLNSHNQLSFTFCVLSGGFSGTFRPVGWKQGWKNSETWTRAFVQEVILSARKFQWKFLLIICQIRYPLFIEFICFDLIYDFVYIVYLILIFSWKAEC